MNEENRPKVGPLCPTPEEEGQFGSLYETLRRSEPAGLYKGVLEHLWPGTLSFFRQGLFHSMEEAFEEQVSEKLSYGQKFLVNEMLRMTRTIHLRKVSMRGMPPGRVVPVGWSPDEERRHRETRFGRDRPDDAFPDLDLDLQRQEFDPPPRSYGSDLDELRSRLRGGHRATELDQLRYRVSEVEARLAKNTKLLQELLDRQSQSVCDGK